MGPAHCKGGSVQEATSSRWLSARETVLVVEPSEFARHRLGAALRQDGRDVRLASTANEGLSMMSALEPALVLVSLELAELPGPRAVEVFAQWGNGVPVVAVGGSPSFDDAVQAVRRGAYDYVSAQEDVEELSDKAERALRAIRQERERARGERGRARPRPADLVPEPRHDGRARPDSSGGSDGCDCAHSGRDGHGQGAGEPGHPRKNLPGGTGRSSV